jgi:hypothetical protein
VSFRFRWQVAIAAAVTTVIVVTLVGAVLVLQPSLALVVNRFLLFTAIWPPFLRVAFLLIASVLIVIRPRHVIHFVAGTILPPLVAFQLFTMVHSSQSKGEMQELILLLCPLIGVGLILPALPNGLARIGLCAAYYVVMFGALFLVGLSVECQLGNCL